MCRYDTNGKICFLEDFKYHHYKIYVNVILTNKNKKYKQKQEQYF